MAVSRPEPFCTRTGGGCAGAGEPGASGRPTRGCREATGVAVSDLLQGAGPAHTGEQPSRTWEQSVGPPLTSTGHRRRACEDHGKPDGAGTGQDPCPPSLQMCPSEDTPGDLPHYRQALAFRAARKLLPRGHRQGPGPDTATPVVSLEEAYSARRASGDFAFQPAQHCGACLPRAW